MKLTLAALNAKYRHTNLAIRYLKQVVLPLDVDVCIREYTINHPIDYIISELYGTQPEVLCFSCNIWNIALTLQIAETMKKIRPELLIILGGPEVSFETEELMKAHDAIDLVVVGEGEKTFYRLIACLLQDEDYTTIPGLFYRGRGQVFSTGPVPEQVPMEDVPFPYQGEPLDPDKIIYYETTRGCPFRCGYCLSSTMEGVRYMPLERVKRELQFFLDQKVKQVKLIDRTFNANREHARAILEYLIEHQNGITNFHFEVAADLLDDTLLAVLERAPVGLFQLEIGVQSTHSETLAAIQRTTVLERLEDRVRRIRSYRNIHQHLDLIVGLPKEDYFAFRRSFDQVFALRPDKLQIGFLKLLKGSALRQAAEGFGLVYTTYPPYEILETAVLSYGEVQLLKGIEEMVEIFWNSGMFSLTVELLLNHVYSSPFKLFESLWQHWQSQGLHQTAHHKNRLYELCYEWIQKIGAEQDRLFLETLKFDYLKSNRTYSLPALFQREQGPAFKDQCHRFLQREENLRAYLPQYSGVPAKQIIKQVWFEPFLYDMAALAETPGLASSQARKPVVLLFHYDLENKALDHAVYQVVSLSEAER